MGDVTKDKDTGPLPIFVPKENGTLEVQVTSEDCLRLIFGTDSNELADGLLRQCVNAVGGAGAAERNFMVAAVKELSPRDGLEGMLATQMAAVHVATTRSARFLANASTLQQVEAHERCLNRLARTFTTQVEALKRYRTGGEQKVNMETISMVAARKSCSKRSGWSQSCSAWRGRHSTVSKRNAMRQDGTGLS